MLVLLFIIIYGDRVRKQKQRNQQYNVVEEKVSLHKKLILTMTVLGNLLASWQRLKDRYGEEEDFKRRYLEISNQS